MDVATVLVGSGALLLLIFCVFEAIIVFPGSLWQIFPLSWFSLAEGSGLADHVKIARIRVFSSLQCFIGGVMDLLVFFLLPLCGWCGPAQLTENPHFQA